MFAPLQREHVRFTEIDRFAMRTKRLKGRSSPRITYSDTPVIHTIATLGTGSVDGVVFIAPDTRLDFHGWNGAFSFPSLIASSRRELGPNTWRHDERGIPYPPMTSHDVTSRVLIPMIYKWKSHGVSSHSVLKCPDAVKSHCCCWNHLLKSSKVSWSLFFEYCERSCSWDTVICLRCISCGESG